MLILEVYKKYVTWPEEFALLMMKHYQDYEVPVMVHMVCRNSGREADTYSFVAKYAAKAETQVHLCCHDQL
jgi:hypothetical protein